MKPAAIREPGYALGHSEDELTRLGQQAQAYAPFTRTLFAQAGIRPGMRILDVGCGAGDVSFLAADLVGPSGEVVGTDFAEKAVGWATARAQAREQATVRFQVGDPTLLEFERPFDAVVGRLVLMYYPDPIAAVQKLLRHVRPGGAIIFQEFDMESIRSIPPAPTFDRAAGWVRRTLSATGTRINMGLELFPVFRAAGLPEPSLRLDALIGGGEDFPYDIFVGVVKSLLPAMEGLQIATAAEVDLETLAERIRDEVTAGNGVVVSPALIGAWSRKPG
jgi:SAM-dependent methyltransferase